MDSDRARGFSVRSGRIILLGDGTELVPDHNDEELFEQTEDDGDVPSTLQRSSPDSTRKEREDTPGPQAKGDSKPEESAGAASISESPSTTDSAKPNSS